MKVLVDGMPRTTGGIGTLLLNIADYSQTYSKNEISFEFIVPDGSKYIPVLKKKGFKYYEAPSLQKIIKYMFFLKRVYSNSSFDYLWFNNTSKVNIILPLYAKKHGTRIITHTHGVDIEEKGIKRVVFKILDHLNKKKMFSLIDVPFACSDAAADVYYNGNAELRKRTQIIRNGIAIDKFTFDPQRRDIIRDELGIRNDEILLGAVGRLTAVKNYPFIINVLSELPINYKMILVGDGEDRDILEKIIEENKLTNRCFILGAKENVFDYYFAMDVFLMPSFNEGLPFSVVEAQCTGLPCVLSDSLTKELGITDLVSFESIDNEKKWVKALLSIHKPVNRLQYPEVVSQKNYGIEQSFKTFTEAIVV